MDPVSFGGETDGASPEQTTEEEYSLLPDFLKNVPEQDRAIVEKYTKEWDAGVTKRFQEKAAAHKAALEPWEKLGVDHESAMAALNVVNTLNNDPARAYTVMGQLIQQNYPDVWEQLTTGEQEELMSEEGQEYEQEDEIPPYVQSMFEKMDERFGQIENRFSQQDQAQIEAQQEAEFDSLLSDLQNKHGKLDQDGLDFAYAKMVRGVDPEQAIKEAVSKFSSNGDSQTRRPVPKIIPGQGGVPSDQVDVSRMTADSRQNLVKSLLEAAQQ